METPDYDALVAEARAQIPGLAPAWTDHNPSDPGIALVELAAFFVEMLLFQAEQVTQGGRLAFLRLLEGPGRNLAPDEDLDAALDAALLRLRTRWRAVTGDDFVELLRDQWPATDAARALGPAGALARVHCLPGLDLRPNPPSAAPHHVAVVVVPRAGDPTPALLAALLAFLEPRRLLTTHLHVHGPGLAAVGVDAELYAAEDADVRTLAARVSAALAALFDPRTGGPDGAGWPFGRAVYVSEVLARIDAVAGVDFVEPVKLVGDPARTILVDGEPVGVRLGPHELVRFDPTLGRLAVRVRSGGSWIAYGE